MKLTLNKAARTCGRAKSTILAAIRDGRLSAPKDDTGRYALDPAELHRVFPFQATDRSSDQLPEPLPNTQENHLNTKALEREIELLREMLAKAETTAEQWRSMAERQQALLEDQRPRGFFRRLWGR